MTASTAEGVCDDLEVEYAGFDAMLAELTDAQWSGPTLCAGWDVRDLICHLWVQAEVAVSAIAGDPLWLPRTPDDLIDFDAAIDASVRERRHVPGPQVWRAWQVRRAEVVAALRTLPADRRIQWTVATMAPATLATTLLMEAWAHGYDVRAPLGSDQPVTPGLRHIAWFALQTLPFAFRRAGEQPVPVRFELTAPDGTAWRLGPNDAHDVVTGDAMELCLRAVRRLELDNAKTLSARGVGAETALRVMRCYP